MRLLLDTHTLLWWNSDAPQLPQAFRAAISDPTNTVFVSAASIWEVAIKRRTGKLAFPGELSRAIEKLGFQPLAISITHAEATERLPLFHGDPFDRMLVAQSQVEDLVLLTVDKQVMRYSPRLLAT